VAFWSARCKKPQHAAQKPALTPLDITRIMSSCPKVYATCLISPHNLPGRSPVRPQGLPKAKAVQSERLEHTRPPGQIAPALPIQLGSAYATFPSWLSGIPKSKSHWRLGDMETSKHHPVSGRSFQAHPNCRERLTAAQILIKAKGVAWSRYTAPKLPGAVYRRPVEATRKTKAGTAGALRRSLKIQGAPRRQPF